MKTTIIALALGLLGLVARPAAGQGAKFEVNKTITLLPDNWNERAVSIGVFKTPGPR
jgi:hypothetical protein